MSELLDRTLAGIRSGQPLSGVAQALFDGLRDERARLGAAWFAAVEHVCRRHPLHAVLGEDPFTARARKKPRGYAGDAVLIDYIYEGLSDTERSTVTELGAAILSITTASASGRAVRERRELLATRIDACALRVTKPKIFAVACGHLREVARCEVLHDGRLGAVYALDQDGESVAAVTRAFADQPEVVPVHASVRDVMRGGTSVPSCDLVYAAGLYDYLPDRIATELTRALFDKVTPGGELIIGNFVPDFPTIGYMEAFMDWTLLCRSERGLRELCAQIDASNIQTIDTWTDASGCVAYISLRRTSWC